MHRKITASLVRTAKSSVLNTAFASNARTTSRSTFEAITTRRGRNMSTTTTTSTATASLLPDAKLTPRRSSSRGHADHGWLNTYHTFSFAGYHDPGHMQFGSLRVLNEDRVAPGTGFPTHPHNNFEIFSYIVSGELTHRDSMVARGKEAGSSSDDFFRMHRGDVQFTTGGSGIAHSEQNEHGADWVHFLQIWAMPWKRGLTPRYHTKSFGEEDKRSRIVPILSPLRSGPGADDAAELAAVPAVEGTIPIHADLVFGASILPPGEKREYKVGGVEYGDGVVKKEAGRRTYIHLVMTGGSGGAAKIRIGGREELKEGDGCYIERVKVGDRLQIESTGSTDAEFVILDSD